MLLPSRLHFITHIGTDVCFSCKVPLSTVFVYFLLYFSRLLLTCQSRNKVGDVSNQTSSPSLSLFLICFNLTLAFPFLVNPFGSSSLSPYLLRFFLILSRSIFEKRFSIWMPTATTTTTLSASASAQEAICCFCFSNSPLKNTFNLKNVEQEVFISFDSVCCPVICQRRCLLCFGLLRPQLISLDSWAV